MSDATPTLAGRSDAYAEIVALVRELVPNRLAQGALLFAIADYGQDCAIESIRQMAAFWTAADAWNRTNLPPRQWGAPL